jgi:hypothetical protein
MVTEKCRYALTGGAMRGGTPEQCCVIGAALFASGRFRSVPDMPDCRLAWSAFGVFPRDESGNLSCREVLGIERDTWIRLVDMNNRTDMTREQIADWLAASGLDAEIPDTLTVAEEMSVADAKARRPEMADKIEAAARPWWYGKETPAETVICARGDISATQVTPALLEHRKI